MYYKNTTLGIDERWERPLCYAGLWITGLIFFFVEQRNATVRRHALQSLLVFGGLGVLASLAGIFSHIWVIGSLFGLLGQLIGLTTVVAWVALIVYSFASSDTPILNWFQRRV